MWISTSLVERTPSAGRHDHAASGIAFARATNFFSTSSTSFNSSPITGGVFCAAVGGGFWGAADRTQVLAMSSAARVFIIGKPPDAASKPHSLQLSGAESNGRFSTSVLGVAYVRPSATASAAPAAARAADSASALTTDSTAVAAVAGDSGWGSSSWSHPSQNEGRSVHL